MSTKEVVLAEGLRTPYGRFTGGLKDIPLVDLGVIPIKKLFEKCSLDPKTIQEVYMGNCFSGQAESPSVVGRQIALKADIPPEVMSVTVDTACCSSLLATRMAYESIKFKDVEAAVAGGVESMSRAPFLVSPEIRWGHRLGPITLDDTNYELGYKEYKPVAVDAGNVALEYGVQRDYQDRWAVRSQERYAQAEAAGKFAEEIVPVEVAEKKGVKIIDKDEQPRPDTSLEKLAKLPTVYGSPTVTPGNAPGLNDGATAILVMSREKAEASGITPLATVVAALGRSTDPGYIAVIPGLVIRDVVKEAGLTLNDIKLIEINEAFAAMPLVSSIILAEGDRSRAEEIQEKINVNGGAIALGHPVGASGGRIVMTLARELKRRGGGYGVAAICGGLAQGEAMVIKV